METKEKPLPILHVLPLEFTQRLSALAPYTMRVKEWQNEVVFLHEVAPGAADRSYGVQVARLAGLPLSVIDRAKTILTQLESDEVTVTLPASALIFKDVRVRGFWLSGPAVGGGGSGPAARAARAATLARAADQFSTTTLPRLNRAADDTSRAARTLSRTAGGVADNPQLFIYGSGRIPPGPGEPGFAP